MRNVGLKNIFEFLRVGRVGARSGGTMTSTGTISLANTAVSAGSYTLTLTGPPQSAAVTYTLTLPNDDGASNWDWVDTIDQADLNYDK